jgi:hypothetical protein
MRVLFVLKYRQGYGYAAGYRGSGLYNSAKFCVDMLNDNGIEAKLVQVVDNNDIDREVAAYRPTHAIIEALWVVPEKFHILRRRHPHVRWVVRIHSKLLFLANEGVAVDWLLRYPLLKNVSIAFNSLQTYEEFSKLTKHDVYYLPNFYPVPPEDPWHTHEISHRRRHVLNVGCFGAVRPLKNTLIQAVGAIRAAEELKLHLHFHINGSRVEQMGAPTLKNLQALFAHEHPHKLVMHKWKKRPEFLELLKTMDVGMQVSLSETFCIVAADMIAAGLPIVVSDEVPWASSQSIASKEDAEDIQHKIQRALSAPDANVIRNRQKLRIFSDMSREWWPNELKRIAASHQ